MSGSPQGKPGWRGWWYGSMMVVFTLLGSAVSTSGPPSGGGSYYHSPPPPPPDYAARGPGHQGGPPGPPSQQGPPQGYPHYPQGPRQGGPGPQQPPPPPPPPSGGAPQGYYPQRDGPRGPYPGGPPAQYGPGGYGGYPGPQQAQQQQQQQENGGGFWSKLKNTVQIFTGNDDPAPGSGGMGGRDGGYGMPSPYPGMRASQEGGRGLPPALPAGPSGAGVPPVPGQPQRPPPPQQGGNPPVGPYPGMAPWRPPQQQQPQQQEQAQGPGLFQRLTAKVISGAQNILDIGPNGNEGRPGGPPPPMGPNYRGNYGVMGQGMYPGPEGAKGPSLPQGPYGAPPSGYGQGQQPPQYGGPRPGERPQPGSASVPPPPRGPYYGPDGYDGRGDGVMDEAAPQPPPPVVEEEDLIPDIFTLGDNIVLVNKPTLLRHKLDRFARAGPHALQVITSFDGGLARFRTGDDRQKAETTESLLHNAVLMPATRTKLRGIVERYDKELEAATSFDERYANRENLKREVQRVVATEGQIYFPSIPAAVQDFQAMLPVRPNLESFLKPLAYHGVPTYVFCAGYGDILAQLLRLGCPGVHTPEGYLPRTVRLVTNQFRTGPNGLVIGFNHPVLHEYNCNMTTAKEFRFPEVNMMMMRQNPMGMMQQQPPPMPHRNVMVVTSSSAENDIAAGVGSEEQLRVVFVDRERLMDLPRFLESADAVVLGDGGMQYVSQLVEHILGEGTGGQAR